MDRRTLLKGTAIASAASIVGARGSLAAAVEAPGRPTRFVTYAGVHFKAQHGEIVESVYWDNGSAYGLRVGAGGGVAISVRLDLPDKATIVEASANLRFNSGDGPAFLRLLAFDTRDNYQVIGQGEIGDPSPNLIRNVPLVVIPTVVDNETWSYLFRWFPSHVESTRRDRPDAPEQLLWGARIGFRHGEA